MKKLFPLFVLFAIIVLTPLNVQAAENPPFEGRAQMQHNQKMKQKFEDRLNLTDKQKEKVKKIHQKGVKQMKPLMQKNEQLRKEIAQIRTSDLDEKTKNEKIKKNFEAIKANDKKAHEIRRLNGKEFEKILTKSQKVELEKMKAEGRKNFAKNHPPRPPFNMFDGDFRGPVQMLPLPPKQ